MTWNIHYEEANDRVWLWPEDGSRDRFPLPASADLSALRRHALRVDPTAVFHLTREAETFRARIFDG